MSDLTGRPTCPRLVALEVTAYGDPAREHLCANVFCLEDPPGRCAWSKPFSPVDQHPLPIHPSPTVSTKVPSRTCDACQETDEPNEDGSWPREWRRWHPGEWKGWYYLIPDRAAGHIHLACYVEWAAKHPDRTDVCVREVDADD